MAGETIRQFSTATRVHVALGVSDVEASRAFYEKLFGTPPAKVRDGYAKFEVVEPPLNISLNRREGPVAAPDPAAHFGIEVKSTAAVAEGLRRLSAAGLATREEKEVTCCFAAQEKVWVTDPDGNAWEVFVVLADVPELEGKKRGDSACCAPAR